MKMKKGLLTMLALLSMGSSAFAQTVTVNVPTVVRKAGEVKEVSVVANRQGKVKIELQNNANYRDLQFDLTLPAGVTVTTAGGVVKDAAEKYTVAFNTVDADNNKVRFVVYNDGQDQEELEKFTDGIIVEIPVAVAETFSGTQPASLTKVLTSDDEARTSIAIADGNFNVRACLLGDVNDNGEVELNDAIWIAKFGINANPTPFVEEVADYNNDTDIALDDAIAIAKSLITTSAKENLIEDDVVEDIVNDIDPE